MKMIVAKENNEVKYVIDRDNIVLAEDKILIQDTYGKTKLIIPDLNESIVNVFEIINPPADLIGKRIGFSGDPTTVPLWNLAYYALDEDTYRYDPQKVIDELNLSFKMVARQRINDEVGDTLDQVADVDKQLNVMTGMIIRMYLLLRSIAGDVPVEIISAEVLAKYDQFANMFVGAVAAGQYYDRTDFEDAEELITKLMQRNVQKAFIVKDEYLDKKQ
ncbi:MAG: hypothetical protein A2V66_16285 [Ignavibacteria bacterium RBG_13_36_8]|nr:MAG: hypothetical protein A2V66_16285 [Ignavibacteria bacterium RBG_13_36_8]